MVSKKYMELRGPLWQHYLRYFLCFAGFGLSLYAFHVEHKKESDRDYEALCDISSTISCSAVFTSKYGRGFGLLEYIVGADSFLNIPNSIFGLIFYSLQCYLGTIHAKTGALLLVWTSIFSLLGSLYLAYILYFVLYDFCVVCISTYIVNTLLFIANYSKLNFIRQYKQKTA